MIQTTLSVVGTWIEHDNYANFVHTRKTSEFWTYLPSVISRCHSAGPIACNLCKMNMSRRIPPPTKRNGSSMIIKSHDIMWYNVRLLCPNSPLPKTQHRTAQTLSTKQWREVRQPGHAPQRVPGLWDFPFFDGRHIMAYKFGILDKIKYVRKCSPHNKSLRQTTNQKPSIKAPGKVPRCTIPCASHLVAICKYSK